MTEYAKNEHVAIFKHSSKLKDLIIEMPNIPNLRLYILPA
jgi:hypothetical protein